MELLVLLAIKNGDNGDDHVTTTRSRAFVLSECHTFGKSNFYVCSLIRGRSWCGHRLLLHPPSHLSWPAVVFSRLCSDGGGGGDLIEYKIG